MFLLCPMSHAAERKYLVALIDFDDKTPNKMAITPGERPEQGIGHLSEVRQVIRELTEKSGIFELLPHETVANAMNTDIGKEAAARRYDRFSAVRLGKMLGVDAILTGEIVQFEKSVITKDFTINGIEFTKRVGDVVIKAHLINAHNGVQLTESTRAGVSDENVLETVSAVVENKLSAGFLQATRTSVQLILRDLGSANIKIDKEYVMAQPGIEDIMSFTVLKCEGNCIYINAGRNRDVSIADLFNILKRDAAGNLKAVAVYRVSMVGHNSSELVLVEPNEALGTILVGDRAQRKTRN